MGYNQGQAAVNVASSEPMLTRISRRLEEITQHVDELTGRIAGAADLFTGDVGEKSIGSQPTASPPLPGLVGTLDYRSTRLGEGLDTLDKQIMRLIGRL